MINKLIDSYYFPNNFFEVPRCKNGAHFVFSDEGDCIKRPIPLVLPIKITKIRKSGSILNLEELYEGIDSYTEIKYLNRNHLEMYCLFKEDKIIFHKESDEFEIVRPENMRLLIPQSEDQMAHHISDYFTEEIFTSLLNKTFKHLVTLNDIATIKEIQEQSIKIREQDKFDFIIEKKLGEEINQSFVDGKKESNRIKRIENLKDQRDQYVNYLDPIRTVIRAKN